MIPNNPIDSDINKLKKTFSLYEHIYHFVLRTPHIEGFGTFFGFSSFNWCRAEHPL